MPCCGKRKLFPLITQILSMSLGLVAFILSAVATSGCEFLAPTGGTDKCYDQFGLFKFNNVVQCTQNGALYASCSKYNNLMLKNTAGSLKPAQAMGAIASAIGGILFVGCLFQLFFKFPAWLFKTVGGTYIFCFVAQMLTLLILNHTICTGDDADTLKIQDPAYQCGLGSDGVTSIVAGIFYLGIGITILVCPVPQTAVITCCGDCCKDCMGEDEDAACGCCDEEAAKGAVIETTAPGAGRSIPGSVAVDQTSTVVTETHNADGTVTVKEERTNPDGSIAVSITTKPASSAAVPSSSV